MGRLILVSNRLPVTVRRSGGGVTVVPSTGGLASALRGQRRSAEDIWIGWPGDTATMTPAGVESLERQLAELGAVPVYLDPAEVDLFYEGFANGLLWPLFHYVTGVLPLHVRGWDAYRSVNERFADAVAARCRPGDVVWVHDYHFLLLPAMLRERAPDVRIGFFLHTPFPTSELFAALPHREELLHGMLGADLVGFHTSWYQRHFESALERLIRVVPEFGEVQYEGRRVQFGVYPIGVDAPALDMASRSSRVQEEVAKLRSDGCRLLVGIDRLDYTKGIPRRLLAIEQLLIRHPQWRGAVRLVQISVPSREHVGAYRTFRREVDRLAGHINGTYGSPHWMPVHYLYQSVGMDQLLALYRAADAVLVTPVRDGMNLVAKEFVAARSDEDGVLLLSEFAGAAADLKEAVQVNPYDLERTADAIHQALTMPERERRERMRALRERVQARDVHWWASEFLAGLRGEARVAPALP